MHVRHLIIAGRPLCGGSPADGVATTLGDVTCGMCHRAYADSVNPRRLLPKRSA